MRTTKPKPSANLAHFVELAAHGWRAGGLAGGGERRVAAIAKCLLENAPGLTGSALYGQAEFAQIAARSPAEARELLSDVD